MKKPKPDTVVIMAEFMVLLAFLILIVGCKETDKTQQQKTLAEKYIRGIYGCDSTVVDELCADDISVSYPIFQ